MRSDMFEVIIERPRRRNGKDAKRAYGGRERERIRRDPDAARACESIRFRVGEPWLNENLAPLRRFLRSRVGRPWNAVHAEICAQIAPTSAVQKHVLDHLAQFVDTHTVLGPDGEVEHALGWRRGWFYVCPRTGLLREWPRVRRVRRVYWFSSEVGYLGPQRELRRVGGVWHLVRYAMVRAPGATRPDPALRERLGATLFAQLEAFHGRAQWVRREVGREALAREAFEALVRAHGGEPPPAPVSRGGTRPASAPSSA